MQSLVIKKYTLTGLISQVLNDVRERILGIYKDVLEGMFENVRDDIIGNPEFSGRGFRYKRWGYTVGKLIQTPIGVLTDVKVPRIRGGEREIRICADRYVRRSEEIEEILIEGYVWGMSSRKLRLWAKRVFGDIISHSGVCRIKDKVRGLVSEMREAVIPADIKIIVVDGLFGRYRNRGNGCVLVAIGIDTRGGFHLLDWMGCTTEDGMNWTILFRRLDSKGTNQEPLFITGTCFCFDTACKQPRVLGAEGFFRHLRTFLKRLPGWVDEDHINLLLGIYLLEITVFKHNYNNFNTQETPKTIINDNFNKIG